jgi:hypothetical protein
MGSEQYHHRKAGAPIGFTQIDLGPDRAGYAAESYGCAAVCHACHQDIRFDLSSQAFFVPIAGMHV